MVPVHEILLHTLFVGLDVIPNLTRHDKRVGAHHHPELAVVDLPVPVLVHRVDHLVDLLVRHLGIVFYMSVKLSLHFLINFARSRHLAWQVGQHKLQLLSGDAPLVVLAEHPESLLQLVFRVSVTELLVHHQTELWEFEEA